MSLPEAASQSLAVLSPLAVRIRAPSGLNSASANDTLMVKGGDEFAGGRIPELGGLVPACRQDPSTVRTKRRVVDLVLMGERRRSACPRPHPRAWRFCLARRQDPSAVRAKRRVVDTIA